MSDGGITFCTFAGGNRIFSRSAKRLQREAEETNWFRKCVNWSPDDLDPQFQQAHGSILNAKTRGYGFWLWKPHLLLQELESSSADFVCYLDAGCVLNSTSPTAVDRLKYYVDFADQNTVMTMELSDQPETMWTKSSLFEYLEVPQSDQERGIRQATAIILKNDKAGREIVKQWLSIATTRNYEFLDDSPSSSPINGNFKNHRHDQSILSCLTKVNGIPAIIGDETFHAPNWSKDGRDFPIWAPRHISGTKFRPEGPSLVQKVERKARLIRQRFQTR